MTQVESLKRLGDNIKVAMGRAGVTQFELAMRAGVSERSIKNWANGLHEPGAIRVKEISVVLGCTTDELLEGVCDVR